MRPDSLQPQRGASGPSRPRIGATVPLRLLGLFLLILAIAVPGCQALLYGETPGRPPLQDSRERHGPAADPVSPAHEALGPVG